MDESSPPSKNFPEKATGEAAASDGAKTVTDDPATNSQQPCTTDKELESPSKEKVEGSTCKPAVDDDLMKESKIMSSDQAMDDMECRSSKVKPDDIPKGAEDTSQVEQANKPVHVDKATGKAVEDTSLGQRSRDRSSGLTLVDTSEELPKPSEVNAVSIEGTDQTSSPEVTITVAQAEQKDEPSDIKDTPSTHCSGDQADSPLDVLEHPRTNQSSTNSSIQSAKTCLSQDLTTPGQDSQQELPHLLHTSSTPSLPSSEIMQTDTECTAKVEDTVNNNDQKCLTSCQESPEVATAVVCQVTVSPEKPAVKDQPELSEAKAQKETVKPPPCTTTNVLDGGSTQNRSMLLKYLGLQPVQEGGKSSLPNPKADASLVKPRMGVPYLDSFSIMPGMELFNPYNKGHISMNTSPFEVCSDGSRSPDPPLLSETPVVGSSPPHHDYDAMEAHMLDRTPRVDSSKGDRLSSFPHPHLLNQDTKIDFNRKQHRAAGFRPSHALDSLCHRLAERVEPEIPSREDTASEGITLNESILSIPSKNQNDHNRYGAKSKKFSSNSDVVPCPRCHRTFKHQNQLRGHLRWHINDPINLLPGRWPKNRSSSNGTGITASNNSGHVQNKSALKKNPKSKTHLTTEQRRPLPHLNGAGAEDTFPCSLCTKVFRTPLKLRGHMMVHKRKQPKTKNIYWRNKPNKRSAHSGRFQCEICSEKFESQLKLNSHLTSHSEEVHPRSKGVKRLGGLASKSSDSNGGKFGSGSMTQKAFMGKRKGPFTCDICFKTFLSMKARNGHKGIHSTKWKIADSQHHVGRPVKIKEEPHNDQFQNEGMESGQIESGNRDESEEQNNDDDTATENPDNPVTQRMRLTYFQCIHCHLVFASRHRVRKHLFKVHSIMPPGTEFFTEEKVEGCKFCEVFKKRKRGRPKRGENTLVNCPHGKVVVGYNLPINSVRLSRKARRPPKRAKLEETEAVSHDEVLQQKCSIKLSPVDINVDRESDLKDGSTKSTSIDQGQTSEITSIDKKPTSEDTKTLPSTATKRRGRPPKTHLKPTHAIQKVRKMVFSLGGSKSCRSGSRAISAIRRRRMGNEVSLLSRQHKSGWDPKRQRFIGRPYKCHLCTMAYRSERQLCGHMRSHGIHIFDLSQLPADQRGNSFISNEDMETKSNDRAEEDTHQADRSTNEMEGITEPTPDVPDPKTPTGESGVGGMCGVCKKEFDSDNMFHQHLLGRYNKKCRQEWMRHTFGFGMRNKVKDLPKDVAEEQNAGNPKDEQSNENLYVIDKINMESFQGSGIFSNLQQKISDKVENVLQREMLLTACATSLESDKTEDTQPLSAVSIQDDPGLKTMVSPKKGSVLNEVINRLTQSSKPDNDIPSSTASSLQSTKLGKKANKGSDKPLFRCNTCNKAFDKKQKLSVHAMIHRPKVATVMDHIENATQRNGSGISAMPGKGEQQSFVQDKVINRHLGVTVTEPVIPAHLIYSCTECPKRFTSNLKLASHLKMHVKSIMNRSPKRDLKPSSKPQEVIAEQIIDAKALAAPTKPTELSTSTILKPDVDKDNAPSKPTPGTEKKIPEKDEVTSNTSNVNVCDITAPTLCTESQTSAEAVQEVPMEQEVKTDREKGHRESEEINTNRPRLLLKINPSTLQRLHDCPECFQSFKSRRQLAHHQRIHVEEKSSPRPLEGNSMVPSDSSSPAAIEQIQPESAKQVSNSDKSKDGIVSAKAHMEDKDHSSLGTLKHANPEDTTVAVKKTSEVHPPEKMVPCKICDKVMKKSQLGGHMRSHTKQLLSRKFSQPESQNGIDHYQFSDPAPSRSIMDRDIISGVDLYRTKSAQSALKSPVMTAVNGTGAFANDEEAEDDELDGMMDDMDDLEEDIQDELSRKQQFMCRICNTMCDNYQQLCQHLKIHVVKNPNFSETAGPPSDTDRGSSSDIPVSKQMPFMENMKEKFSRPKVYPCELCGFSFASFRQFRVHISQTHGGKYQYRLLLQQKEAAKAGAFLKEPDTINKTHPHKCDVCGRRFKRLALLIFHLNKLHKGWKQRLCMMNVRSRPRPPTVQKTSAADGASASGPNAAVDPADLPFTCELCGKSFRMKVQLCGHMKTHGRVGHSPIKITPLSMKGGKYTLRKSRKPDFRLSDEWITDMDDEQMPFENSMALQQMPPRPNMLEQPNKMKSPSDASVYASMYAAKPIASDMAGAKKILPGLAEHSDHYRMPLSSPEMPMTPPALDLKIPAAPPPPDPSKFITMQMEPVLQQMLHRCLLCHSYFSSQESAVQHCKEVHFKKKNKSFSPHQVQNPGQKHKMISPDQLNIPGQRHRILSTDQVQSPGNLPGHPYQMSGGASGMRPHSTMHSPPVHPARQQMSPSQQQVSPSLQPPVPQRMPYAPSMIPQMAPGMRPTSQVPSHKPPGLDQMNLPPSRFPVNSSPSPMLPFPGTMPKSAPASSPSAKTISQTPFNEMLYRVETTEGQTRYVCNTCKSTFLHYNFLMSHLADHNHLAYTCLQCGYATYSEKDYQLHCQLHDGQISKKIRRVRPKPPGFSSNMEEKVAPRAVATCHICQRSFVNMTGLKAHMILHSANYNSVSERRNESKRVPKRNVIVPVAYFNEEVSSEPLSLVKPREEQTEALDLTVKPVVESPADEVLDLSMGRSNFPETPVPEAVKYPDSVESPELDDSLDMAFKIVPEASTAVSLPDVCQVMQQIDVPDDPSSSPTPPSGDKLTHMRKPKNSIRLVGAIDVDVASLENKYSVVTDLMDTDSDISPDPPLSGGHESPARSGEGEGDHDGKSPKRARNYKCTMCQYATDFKDSMDRHEQKHRKFRTLACHQCSYRTPEKRLMLRHVLTIHEKQKPYECKLCNYSSAYKHHLKRHHTKRHQRPLLTCSLCEFTTDEVSKLESHIASHPEPKVYNCKLCPMVFNSSKLFKAHKQIVHHKKSKKHKKSKREKNQSSSSVVQSSESTTEGKDTEPAVVTVEKPEEPVVFKHPCNLCSYKTDDQNELTIHLMKTHFSSQIKEGLGDVCSTAQCPQCGYLTGQEQMKAHMQIHDSGELFNCDQCLFKACSQEEVDEHVQQKHKVKLAPTHVCKMCSTRFWSAEDLKQHTEMHLKDTSISVKNPFLCNMCPLKLMNRRDALRHLQLHTDRYPFKCRHCVFSCFTKASIQRHLAIHRQSSKPKSLNTIRKNGHKSRSMGASGSSSSENDVHKSQRKTT